MNKAKRIEQLRNLQAQEVENGFKNLCLWNECEDRIYLLQQYGQESAPLFVNGLLLLEDGRRIYLEGMSCNDKD